MTKFVPIQPKRKISENNTAALIIPFRNIKDTIIRVIKGWLNNE